MSIEVFKLGPLIATVKTLSSRCLYRVGLTGEGDSFEASVESPDALFAVAEVVLQLAFAADHPKKFFNRRKLAADRSGAEGHDLQKMIDVANEAVQYAARNAGELKRAVESLKQHTARKLGD